MSRNRALSSVGSAAITARMTDAEVERNPVAAMTIAMDAMRATLGLAKPAALNEQPRTSESGKPSIGDIS